MKLIALVISFIMIINDAMAGVMVANTRLQIEKNLITGLKIWNQSKDFEQLVNQLPIAKGDKDFILTKLTKAKLQKTKPPKVDFLPEQRKLTIHQKRTLESLWVLEFVPNIIIYDGQLVQEFQPKVSIQEILNEISGVKKLKFKSTSKKKNVLLEWLLPEAQAQFMTNLTTEQKVALEAQQQAEAARQTKLVKSILLVTLFSFIGFLVFGYLWSKFSGSKPSVVDAEEIAKKEGDKKIAELHLTEIKHELFEVEEPLISMTCEKEDQSSRLKQISFQSKNGAKAEYDFTGDSSKLQEMIAKNDTLAKKLYNADFCCQHSPCKEWLDLKPIDHSIPLKNGPAENLKAPELKVQTVKPEESELPVSDQWTDPANK